MLERSWPHPRLHTDVRVRRTSGELRWLRVCLLVPSRFAEHPGARGARAPVEARRQTGAMMGHPERATYPAQIGPVIVVNGAPCSGKSTTARALQAQALAAG